jgi:hypothetical protein
MVGCSLNESLNGFGFVLRYGEQSLVVSSRRRPESIANHIRKSSVETEQRVAVALVE